MRIIHLSYANIKEYNNPNAWLKKLSFYVGILEAMTQHASIKSIHCISYEGVVLKNQVEYHFLKRSQWQLWFPIGLHLYLKKLQPDAIIVHGLVFPWQVILLRWQLGSEVKLVAQHHAEKPFFDLRKYLQRWADKYIGAYLFCSTEQGLQWVSSRHINQSNKVKEVMGTSSPFHVIEKQTAKDVTKVKNGNIYLWVGRLDHNKDPLIVARTFIRFHTLNQSVHLYMIYQTFELLNELQAIVSSVPHASDFVHFVGKVNNEDLLYWYNSADFIISSSHYEGSGVAVCEGLSCGCIPILTNIPSFRMMTNHGRIGLLYEAGNDDELLNSLERSLRINKNEMKTQVLTHFDRNLSFKANARNITDVICTIK
jgi:glycosyltransferase involved in cell wall biosynthesis